MLLEQQTHLFLIFSNVLTMSSHKKSKSKGSTGRKAAQAEAKSTAETARDAASLGELTRPTSTPTSSDRVLWSDKRHIDEWGMDVNAQTVTGTESERDESENSMALATLSMQAPDLLCLRTV